MRLNSVLGVEFMERLGRIRKQHPILMNCDKVGADSFLELNSLAEDIEVLRGIDGLQSLLHDLKQPREYLSARHTIRTAALFERRSRGTVTRLIRSLNADAPDFVVKIDGREWPVEAKLLTTSEVEERFNRTARSLSDALIKILQPRRERCIVYAVISDATKDVSLAELRAHLGRVPNSLGTVLVDVDNCRMRIDITEPRPNHDQERVVHVLSPVHEKDYLRVRPRASKASGQLRAFAGSSGILALGLHPVQDPSAVFALLENLMRRELRGISVALLSKTHIQTRPPQFTVVDLLEVRENSNATSRLPGNSIRLHPLGAAQILTLAQPPATDQPTYRYVVIEARIADASRPFALDMPYMHKIPSNLFSDAELNFHSGLRWIVKS